ncbi:hypothetical protein JWZ98_01740 [Methylomonas sp. EFPC1]|uniref:hypothetical protein n=1 Tax=unclassified Methylomonas TaxID=2608980 RepID=UPI00051BFB21|nr:MULTISPECIES: hypothetical protein [unclassified Methylomonas]PKD42288.1 hypothetical protein CWO84_00350 [Methylomonas sp. Kb3]QBC25790.1 hypothetical protein U737_02030 [Methylomonas sp. LW13]QSB01711.1 hypothetical protein JWZ98_01740 [Methylomonas sp. EFPC1]
MDTNKPLLSALFFIGLSFWGIQLAQAATTENTLNPLESFQTILPDLPSAYQEQPLNPVADKPLQDYALTLFTRVKTRAVVTFQQALSDIAGLGDMVSQMGLLGLLGTVFQPVIDESKTAELKAALPTAAWFFLSGMLGVLGLKKRSNLLDTKAVLNSVR